MLPRRSKLRRSLILMASVPTSLGEVARGLWRSPTRNRWLLPLIFFLFLLALFLLLAGGVEFIAPFIYTIF